MSELNTNKKYTLGIPAHLDIKDRALLLMGALYDNEEIGNIIFTLDSCSDVNNAVIHISESNLSPEIYLYILELLREYFTVDPSICLMAIDTEDNKVVIQR